MKQLLLFPVAFKTIQELLNMYPCADTVYLYTDGEVNVLTNDFGIALCSHDYYPDFHIIQYDWSWDCRAFVVDKESMDKLGWIGRWGTYLPPNRPPVYSKIYL